MYTSKTRCFLPVFVVISLVIFQSLTVRSEDNCAECSIKINTTIDLIRESFRSRDPINLDVVEPCELCVFGGIVTIESNGDVCSEKVMEGDDVCYDHKLKLKFSGVYSNCTCVFPINPADLAKMMADNAKKPYGGEKCMESGNGQKVPMKLIEEAPEVAAVDPATIMALKECQPSPPADPFAKPPPKTTKGGVLITYANFKMEVVLRSCKINTEVRTMAVNLENTDPKDVKVNCIYDEANKIFLEPCLCFCKFDYMDKISTTSMKSFFPCYGDQKVNENADLLHQLTCNDLVEED